ncbi:MAG: TIGR04283 family arsenosugar biosynthesis glycosyltransferase [Candidatus Omnitrophica bacterium]|nr:TIGR04283 family arsenosugar biosynthesis glycosyltransferase [Candidatus Omnitrophota bacterium]
MVSVIVPVYNEEKILSQKKEWFRRLSLFCELIFADGGSRDGSAVIAAGLGRLVRSGKGRGVQMNKGAESASCGILLFLPADALISPETLKFIEEEIARRNIIAGCLSQRLSGANSIFRLVELIGNLRASFTKIFYTDQGIFVKRDIFYKMGGFAEVPLMEDAIFSAKLKKAGNTAVLRQKIFVSTRRWEKKGILKTIFIQSFINILFMLKFPLNPLSRIYGDLR